MTANPKVEKSPTVIQIKQEIGVQNLSISKRLRLLKLLNENLSLNHIMEGAHELIRKLPGDSLTTTTATEQLYQLAPSRKSGLSH
jgi:hypothetical protein